MEPHLYLSHHRNQGIINVIYQWHLTTKMCYMTFHKRQMFTILQTSVHSLGSLIHNSVYNFAKENGDYWSTCFIWQIRRILQMSIKFALLLTLFGTNNLGPWYTFWIKLDDGPATVMTWRIQWLISYKINLIINYKKQWFISDTSACLF